MESKFIDWYLVDIIVGLCKKGILMVVELCWNGLSLFMLVNVLMCLWLKGELIIVKVLGMEFWVIWLLCYYDLCMYEFIDRMWFMRVCNKDKQNVE